QRLPVWRLNSGGTGGFRRRGRGESHIRCTVSFSHHPYVVGLFGNDVPYSAARVRYISVIARDHMKMQVRDRLPRGLTDVDAEIVAVGLADLLNSRPRFCDDGDHLALFLVSCLKP